MALNATVGSATADSYMTVADADAHFDTRLNVTAWTSASTANKERALKSSTREIDLSNFFGSRTETTQALAWPRVGVTNPDTADDAVSDELDDDAIPVRVVTATAELALAYLNAGTTDLSLADTSEGVIRKAVGPIETEWTAGARATGLARYPLVYNSIFPFLAGSDGTTWERR